jgi:hypothetical protein
MGKQLNRVHNHTVISIFVQCFFRFLLVKKKLSSALENLLTQHTVSSKEEKHLDVYFKTLNGWFP